MKSINANNHIPLPQRRKPATGVFPTTNAPTIVFLTVCTQKRSPWLAAENAHELIRGVWMDAKAWSVGFYLLMPDHLHLFCAPHDMEITLGKWVRYWKSITSKRCADPKWRWQSTYWDTRLRRSENYHQKWEYVRMNPVRKGLVKNPEQWPYQGCLNELRW